MDKHKEKENEHDTRELLQATIDSSLYWVKVMETARNAPESKKAGQQIEQSHFIKGIAEAVPDLIAIFEIPSWEPLYYNRQPFAMTGFSIEEIAGMNNEERMNIVVHPDHRKDLNDFYTRLEQLKQGEVTDVEYRFHKKAAGEAWVHVKGMPFKVSDGKITQAICIVCDISEEKRIEREMLNLKNKIAQKAKDKYYSIFNSINEGFCIFELVYDNGKAIDLRWMEVNPAYEKQTGLKDIVGKLVSEVMPGTEGYWLSTYEKVAKTGEAVHFENWHELTGHWYYTFSSRIGGTTSRQIAVVFADITERKQLERRQEYLLKLNDTLRFTSDPVEIEEKVTAVAMDYFGADRCYYCTIEGGDSIIRRDARKEGLSSVAGTYPLSSFTLLKKVIDKGAPFVVHDARTSNILDEPLREICLGLQGVSFLDVPLIKNGQATGILCLVQTTPRNWTEADVQLAVETAERTWAAVERARAEEALRASEKRLKELNENLGQQVQKRTRELTALKIDREKEKLNAIIFTQEQERARISEGLHDGVAQLLYAAQSRLQLVKPGENGEQELKEAIHILTEAIQETRKVSFELMPPVLRDYGLEVCLKTLADRVANRRLRLLWNVRIPGRLPEKLEITIYRIVQEILNNILKHASATEASVSLRLSAKYVHLKVSDKGKGFVVKRSKNAYSGIGLQSIHNRVKLLKGKIRIASAPGQGTDIELQLPLRDG